jgi:hypothetical protein
VFLGVGVCVCVCVCVCVRACVRVCVCDITNRDEYREIPCKRYDMDCTLLMYVYVLFPRVHSTNNLTIAILEAHWPLVVPNV